MGTWQPRGGGFYPRGRAAQAKAFAHGTGTVAVIERHAVLFLIAQYASRTLLGIPNLEEFTAEIAKEDAKAAKFFKDFPFGFFFNFPQFLSNRLAKNRTTGSRRRSGFRHPPFQRRR
jgi:hypothetical protein